jgi:hypothetical protein
MAKIISEGLVIWPDDVGGNMSRPRYKTYYNPETEKPKPVSSWIERAGVNDRVISEQESEYDLSILTSGMTQEGGKLLQQIFGSKVFAYPKPLSLLRSIVRATTRAGDIVLDSFAGTGTTGHAVLDLEKEDGSDRRFILVEMDENICRDVTAQRLTRVIHGYGEVAGLGGGYRFCTLGEPLFDERGQIRDDVRFPDLAAHIFFTETGTPIPKRVNGRTSLLGVHNGKAVYLLFNGVLGDKRPNGGNVLTGDVLRNLPAHDGPKVIYGESCRLGADRLRRASIVFKQVPYEIRVS